MLEDFEAFHMLEEIGECIDYAIICPAPPTVGSIAVVDPFSTGAHLAALVLRCGYKLILIFTQRDAEAMEDGGKTAQTLLSQYGANYKPTLLVQHNPTGDMSASEAIDETLDVLKKQESTAPVLAILPGCYGGINLADELSTAFHTRCNDIRVNRNKTCIQNAMAASSDDHKCTINELVCLNEDNVTTFWNNMRGKSAIVKPCDSTGGDAVTLCHSLEEAVYAYNSLNGHTNALGSKNSGGLIQEYVAGREYIVDGVARDGKLKVTALWECEKRNVNGCDFVPFSMSLRPCSGKLEHIAMVEFAKKVCRTLSKYFVRTMYG